MISDPAVLSLSYHLFAAGLSATTFRRRNSETFDAYRHS